MPTGAQDPSGPVSYDDGFDFDWGPVKPYMDGDELVIPVMDVIADSFWGSGLSAKAVQKALLKHKDAARLKLLINSPGGNVHEGTAVYNLLLSDPRPIAAHVIGLAASMASVVMLAADERVMHAGSMVMVHEPSLAWTGGNRHELQTDVDRLTATAASMLDIYEARLSEAREARGEPPVPRSELEQMMTAEKWLTADEARSLGFATDVVAAADEPMMAAAASDPGWNVRRGAALSKYSRLPAEARQGGRLGWQGPNVTELRAGLALADANDLPTLAVALDGVRRTRTAQQPRPQASAQPQRTTTPNQAPTTRTNTMQFSAELLAKLKLPASASEAEVLAAMTKMASDAEDAKRAREAAEAKAEEERLARITAEAKANAEAAQRAADAAKAAKEREAMAHKAAVDALLADVIPSNVEIITSMCWTEVDGEKIPNASGFEHAKRLVATNESMRKSSLMGQSNQAQAARVAAASGGEATKPAPGGRVQYKFAGASLPLDLTRITGVTPEKIEARMAAMKARAENRD